MECDPQEHVTLWNCSHGVRINEPVCMECLLEEKEASDLPGWPLIPTFRQTHGGSVPGMEAPRGFPSGRRHQLYQTIRRRNTVANGYWTNRH